MLKQTANKLCDKALSDRLAITHPPTPSQEGSQLQPVGYNKTYKTFISFYTGNYFVTILRISFFTKSGASYPRLPFSFGADFVAVT